MASCDLSKKQEIPVLRDILLSVSDQVCRGGRQTTVEAGRAGNLVPVKTSVQRSGRRLIIIYARQPALATTDLMLLLTALILYNRDGENVWPGSRGVCLIKLVDPALKNVSSLKNWWFLVDDFSSCFWSVIGLFLGATHRQENKHSKNNWAKFFARPKAKVWRHTHLIFLWF